MGLTRVMTMPHPNLAGAIHEGTQHFIHAVMGPPTRKAVKYDKKGLRHQLMQLRNSKPRPQQQ